MKREEKLVKEYSRIRKDFLRALGKDLDQVSFLCATLGVPLIVAWTFVRDEYPEFEKLAEEKLDVYRDFYGLD